MDNYKLKNNLKTGQTVDKNALCLQQVHQHLLSEIAASKAAEEELRQEKKLLRVTLSSIGDGVVVVDKKGLVTLINPAAEELTGWQQAGALGRPLDKVFVIINEHSRQPVENPVQKVFKKGKIIGLANHTILISREGRERAIADSAAPVKDDDGNILGAVLVFRDVSKEREQEKALCNAKRQLHDIIEFLPDATFAIDRDQKVMAWNRAMEHLTGIPKRNMLGKGGFAYAIPFHGEPKPILINLIGLDDDQLEKKLYPYLDRQGGRLIAETYAPCLYNNKGALLWAMASPLLDDNGEIIGAVESIRDISEQRQVQARLQYMTRYDSLTRMHNRIFFEETMTRYARDDVPVGVVLSDVDGLKLINDTLGNEAGDQILVAVAEIIKEAVRENDIVARIGSDEFAVLLPGAEAGVMRDVCDRVNKSIAKYNSKQPQRPVSISIGFAVGHCRDIDLLYKEATNNMNREKLLHGQSSRSAMVQTLMEALNARDFITEGHADRLNYLMVDLAGVIGLPQQKANDLRLLAKFHDIGKVGIPDRILFKEGPLTPGEYDIMKKHSEIGYRIALSSTDLAPIADLILKHHEWWDGNGYPLGLKGQEIPWECRILSIADAFDAMTNDRPYRKALSWDEAKRELEKCAGTQFDPQFVEKFIFLLDEYKYH